MTPRFDGKVIVVTGGSSGIGRAVAQRIAAEGGCVVIGARGAEAGEAAAAAIRADGGRAEFVATDVTVEADVARLVGTALERFGRLDGAFNNVGGVTAAGPIADLDAAGWQAELDLNLTSVFYCLKHELPALRVGERDGGAIVNNASALSVTGAGGMAAYTAAKHGVVGLTRAAALESARAGIRVNALVTHAVDTPLFHSLAGDSVDATVFSPAGRLSRPDEVAAFAAFLLSDEAGFVTGAALAIDGGYTAQ
jgi:NAD(P)-dependent dehydrogenase (short-subunit alcohol dehydrogenase family)